jgi:hypothetical protein
MLLSFAARVALFPTSGAIPEGLQIGRTTTIDQITARALGGETQLLAEDRHLGKSSVLLAMTDRALRGGTDEDRLVLSVDLRDGIAGSDALARRLLEQASQQHAGTKIAALAKRGNVKRLTEPLRQGVLHAGQLFGLSDEAAIIDALASGLTPTAEVSFDAALRALDARGQAVDARAVIVLDEAQEIAAWDDTIPVQNALASTIKRAGSSVAFVVSGSEKHTLEALFDQDESPLRGLGVRVTLPPISRDDWVSGLLERYAQAEIEIATDEIHQILYYSVELPLPTMLICQHTLDWLENDVVTAATVTQAIADARRHPSWELSGE